MAAALLLALLTQAVASPSVSPAAPLFDPSALALLPPAEDDLQVGDAFGFNDPPFELIDFLGRRSLCADVSIRAAERERLHCAALAREERAWRTRFAGNAHAVRWLDQAPLEFRLERRFVGTFDGPVPARPRRIEQSGVDADGRHYRLTIDTEAEGGRSTRIAAAYEGWPERSFTLSNRLFPLIDLQSLSVASYFPPHDRRLEVEFSYGHDRIYCGTDGDNRQTVTVSFEQSRVRAEHLLRTNCGYDYVTIEEGAAR